MRLSAIAACGVMFVSAACGGSAPQRARYVDRLPAPEEPMVVEGEVGTYGGRFVQNGNAAPATFNAVVSTTVASNELIGRMFTPLVSYNGATQEIAPGLATRWNRSDDGLTWTFHLRRGVKFSDGHPITAEDVMFTFAAIYDPRSSSSAKALLSSNGQPWELLAPDPLTVTIRTPVPVGAMPSMLLQAPILPKHVLEPRLRDGTFNSAYGLDTPPDALVTSGAWKLKSFVANDRTVLTRNPYWFRVDTKGQRLPYLDELTIVVVPDAEAADLKFRAGELDALSSAAPANFQWYEEHQQEGRFVLYDLGPTLGTTMLWFNLNATTAPEGDRPAGSPIVGAVKYGWFNNAAFRRAVSMGIDRQAIIKSVYYGGGVASWSSATPGDKLWGGQDVPHADYDPAQARQLLAGMGWADHDGNGVLEDAAGHEVSFTLKLSSGGSGAAMASFIRDDLAKIGIRVNVSVVEFNTLIQSMDYEARLGGLAFGTPDPARHATLWRSNSSLHQWRKNQPTPATPEEARIDTLVDRVSASTDIAERQQAFAEIQRIANEQCWVIWMPVALTKAPVRARFGNVHPVAGGGLGRFAEQQFYVKQAGF